MGIHVALEHRTIYRFDRATTVNPHVLRLRPAPHSRTPIVSYALTVAPDAHFINWQQDPFGNFLARLVFPDPTHSLEFNVGLVAELTVINPFDFFVEESAESYPFEYEERLSRDLEPYLRPLDHDSPQLDRWLADKPAADGQPIIDFLVDINRRVYNDIGYLVRMQPGVQTPEETLSSGIGSCRDSGWLLVEALRRLGLAARFVSGYLVQLAADQKSLDGPSGPEADFTDLHAWAEVYIPGAGWIGLDPTSGLFAGEGHIPLACTPHPQSAAPITGTTSPTEVTFEFANTVIRVREDPRVTKPYSDRQWGAIDALGAAVDQRLADGDVRLTMGGEPTFVSIDNMDGDEWNMTADSAEKRQLANNLALRLRDRFAVGGLLRYGQGKWYPGEPLPRWQIDIVWRLDGQPLWYDPKLLADPANPGAATLADSEAFAHAVAERLGFDTDLIVAAYEDPLEPAIAEARQPAGEPPTVEVTPDDARSAVARTELIERMQGDLSAPVGWVLPLHRTIRDRVECWASTRWRLRRDHLFLIPGDSPIGLRLPLDSLTWADPPPVYEPAAFEARPNFPATGAAPTGNPVVVDVEQAAPTALGFELREQHVAVFLPPFERAEHALEVIGVLEAVATELNQPVIISGYGLPTDPRLNSLSVTPDPGVIEVNVQPTASWSELRAVIETLNEEARQVRLGTEKFALDGSHTGTGGGNHVTLGGRTPADSPMLRRPELLASMVAYWQRHPALSYLFSGQFIGPTSQAPRVDEGRTDTIYELEIALAELFAQVDKCEAGQVPSWIVDRLLRHLLVDLTGNTHRAEFCIDKLYSPDSERGRLGIVELRAFEMPPHPQMALVQALLVRSLVARFWEQPFRGRLVRWGTELYDRFGLPWYVAIDIGEVIDDLAEHGIAFDRAWLDPFMEFRFPLIGERTIGDVRLELRRAIEPWHVLGEEATESGTARYVDSSVERLQLRVDGYDPVRHAVTCNGKPVPLQATESAGTHIAGVRFKAWTPWSALHPTIDAHSPLTFSLIGRVSGRALGGFRYSVAHPGGRNYETFPVNAAEAEARRAARFTAVGYDSSEVDVAALDAQLAHRPHDYPRTLDLRY